MKQYIFLFLVGFLISCEKPLIPDENNSKDSNVTLVFTPYKMFQMTRGSSDDLSTTISKINLMLFDEDGKRAFDKVKLQKSDDEHFGIFYLNLLPGEYTVVAVGHSGGSSVSIPSTTEVTTNTNNGVRVTDTHYYYGSIDVAEEPEEYEKELIRNTAKIRIVMTDSIIPEAVSRLKFSYTGGSYNFNPKTGLGLPNKTSLTQTEYRTISDDKIAEVYTFPYSATDTCYISLKLIALGEDDTELKTHIFEKVPVMTGYYTEYKGKMFDGDDTTVTHSTFGFTIKSDWKGSFNYEF